MTDRDNTDLVPHVDRQPDGRFAPGNQLGTPFGPDNPPPRSPGRPRKDAWVRNLEQRLRSDERIGTALADRLIKIALKGRDNDALRAIQEVQDRVGGPLKLRVDGLSEDDIRERLRRFVRALVKRLPPEHHQAVSEALSEGFAAEEDFE